MIGTANWCRAGTCPRSGSRVCSDAGVKDLEKEDGDRNITAGDIIVGYVRCGQEQLPLEASSQVSGEFDIEGESRGREAGKARGQGVPLGNSVSCCVSWVLAAGSAVSLAPSPGAVVTRLPAAEVPVRPYGGARPV